MALVSTSLFVLCPSSPLCPAPSVLRGPCRLGLSEVQLLAVPWSCIWACHGISCGDINHRSTCCCIEKCPGDLQRCLGQFLSCPPFLALLQLLSPWAASSQLYLFPFSLSHDCSMEAVVIWIWPGRRPSCAFVAFPCLLDSFPHTSCLS